MDFNEYQALSRLHPPSSRSFTELELRLQEIHAKRKMLERRTEQKIGLLGKMESRRRDGHLRLLHTIEEQNDQARQRNQALLEEVTLAYNRSSSSSLSMEEVENIHNYRGRVTGVRQLEEAKKNFVHLLESSSKALHQGHLLRMEQKMKALRDEEQQALQRAENLRQQRMREELLAHNLEHQRQKVLQSLAVEHHERLEAEAAALLHVQLSKATDEAFQQYILEDTDQVQKALSDRVRATESARVPLTVPVFQSSLVVQPTQVTPPYSAMQGMSIPPNYLSAASAGIIQGVVGGEGGASAAISSVGTGERYFAVPQPITSEECGASTIYPSIARNHLQQQQQQQPVGQQEEQASSFISSVHSSLDISRVSSSAANDYRSLARKVQGLPDSEPNSPAKSSPAASLSRGLGLAIDTNEFSVSSLHAATLSAASAASPAVSPSVARGIAMGNASYGDFQATSPGHRAANAGSRPSAAMDDTRRSHEEGSAQLRGLEARHSSTADEFALESSAAQAIGSSVSRDFHQQPSPLHPKGSSSTIMVAGEDEFDIITDDAAAAPTAASAATASTSTHSILQPSPLKEAMTAHKSPLKHEPRDDIVVRIIADDFAPCAKLLQSLYPSIEQTTKRVDQIVHMYSSDQHQRQDAQAFLQRHLLKKTEWQQVQDQLEGSLIGHMVLILVEVLGHILLPKEAFTGVVSNDKLKKEHKKSSIPNIFPCWEGLCKHLQHLVESQPGSLDFLSKTFTSALVAHVPSNDRDRMHRKVFNLLQLAILPSDSQQDGSPQRSKPRTPSFDLSGGEAFLVSSDVAPRNQSLSSANFFTSSASNSIEVSAKSLSNPSSAPKPGLLSTHSSYGALTGATASKLTELDDELLDDEIIPKPPPIKDLDATLGHMASHPSTSAQSSIPRTTNHGNFSRPIGLNEEEFDF